MPKLDIKKVQIRLLQTCALSNHYSWIPVSLQVPGGGGGGGGGGGNMMQILWIDFLTLML